MFAIYNRKPDLLETVPVGQARMQDAVLVAPIVKHQSHSHRKSKCSES
jgi:hypothetical protein